MFLKKLKHSWSIKNETKQNLNVQLNMLYYFFILYFKSNLIDATSQLSAFISDIKSIFTPRTTELMTVLLKNNK